MVAERAEIFAWLADVPDPEIPAISICDLGIVRDAWWSDELDATLHVAITPTYAGCPAMRTIASDVVAALHARGIANVAIETRLSPPWTTDWLTADGREKLRAFGISPPRARDANDGRGTLDLVSLLAEPDERAACPRCASTTVVLVSRFASTPCKALYRCGVCREPFDHFKTH